MSSRLLPLLAFLLAVACASNPHPTTVPFHNASIFVDDGGRGGVPLLFIHGNGGNSEQWHAQLAYFRQRGHRAVAIDLPGFGQSPLPEDHDQSLNAMSAAIDRVVHRLALHRFVIVGHSYAGAVVANYAASHAENVAGVVYVDAAAGAVKLPEEQKAQFTAALRKDKMAVVRGWFAPMLKKSPAEVQQQVLSSVEKTSVDSLIAALNSLADYDAKRLVSAYQGPKLAIVAADLETPASFQKQFPEIRSVRIANAGHWLMLDKPDEVNEAIEDFVR